MAPLSHAQREQLLELLTILAAHLPDLPSPRSVALEANENPPSSHQGSSRPPPDPGG